jgi:hypothetical protein
VKIVRFLTAKNPSPANARIGVALGAAVFDYSAAHQTYEREVTGEQWPMITDTVQLIRLGRFTTELLNKILDWAADADRLEEVRLQFLGLRPEFEPAFLLVPEV